MFGHEFNTHSTVTQQHIVKVREEYKELRLKSLLKAAETEKLRGTGARGIKDSVKPLCLEVTSTKRTQTALRRGTENLSLDDLKHL